MKPNLLTNTASKRPAPWLDHDLSDRTGEEWRDVIGYDALYHVSSHGRIKSLARQVMRQNRGAMWFPERIMRQVFNTGAARVGLSEDGIKKAHTVLQLVANAFLPKLTEGHIWYHRNKHNLFNNSLDNIVSGTLYMTATANYQAGLIPNSDAIAQVQRDNKKSYDEIFNVVSAGAIVARICSACMMEQPLTHFYQITEERLSRICKTCTAKRSGVVDIGATARKIELAKAGLRICSVCKQPKRLDDEFGNNKRGYLGKQFACKPCTNRTQKAQQDQRKKLLGAANKSIACQNPSTPAATSDGNE